MRAAACESARNSRQALSAVAVIAAGHTACARTAAGTNNVNAIPAKAGVQDRNVAVIPAKAGVHVRNVAVIPAKAGIHGRRKNGFRPGFRRGDALLAE